MTRALVYTGAPGECLASVRFKPGAAFTFLHTPAAELTDRVVPAGDLGKDWLCARPRHPAHAREALAELERRLLERVGAAERDLALRLDPRLCQAARRLLGERAPSVDALAHELGLSRQHLARVFRQRVGVSPKTFAGVARLQRAVDLLGRAESPGLAEAALALGYYDQAHMCRDFRELCALSPREVRAARGSIFPIRSLWLEA
jgi:AraC-like DNA-binding protein